MLNRVQLFSVAVLTTGLSSPLVAQNSPPKEAAAVTAPSDKVRCKYEGEMGSRTRGKRVCKTYSEWQADADAVRRETDSNIRKNTATGTPS